MHDHSHHHHHHHPGDYNRAFAVAVALNFGFVLLQAGYAVYANSMSLLADAGHNLGDVLGLLMAWLANWLLTRPTSDRYSYGHKKTTVFAAVLNALMLVATSAIIGYESIQKVMHPQEVNEFVIMVVASIGILVNGGTAMLFWRGHEHDLNIKSAFLHLAYDALISLGVVFTGLVIYYTDWYWLDPAIGLAIIVTILFGTWALLRDSVNLMLDAVPHNIDQSGVRDYLLALPGVKDVHDLHIWGLSTRETALTAHLIMPTERLSDDDYRSINEHLAHNFAIHHVTLQIEQGDNSDPCGQYHSC